jgi:parallel beta-helix repeat protein
LQALVDAAPSGGTLITPACIYREMVSINKPLTLSGQGAEIRGSDVWTGWTPGSDGLYRKGPLPSLYAANDPQRCATPDNRCLAPEQVFIDGSTLERVMSGNPATGQFAVDGSRNVVLANNPNGHVVEVSVRPFWITTKANGVTVRGFTMRHAANDSLTGGISNSDGYSLAGYSDFTVAETKLFSAHGSGVSIRGGNNVQVLDNEVAFAGNMGVHGTDAHQIVVRGNHIHDNNTDKFNWQWGAGGLKITHTDGATWEANEVDHNHGPGMWCDIKCSNVTIDGNRVHHNFSPGIFWEISTGAVIRNNSAWENGKGFSDWGYGGGIIISSAGDAEVYGNTLANNADGITVMSQNRADAAPTTNINIHDNTIIGVDNLADIWNTFGLGWIQDSAGHLFDAASNNHGERNNFWYSGAESCCYRYSWNGPIQKLSTFAATPGNSGGRYLTTAEKNQALAAAGI